MAPVLLPALVILLAFVLRLAALGVDVRLHPDEALFAAQARQISAEGDWLLRGAELDKPPLTLYTVALSFAALGSGEFAARLPAVFASALTVAALYRLALALYGDRAVGLLAALLLALSPFDLAFAATVFTDGQATLWSVIAALLAARGRWRLAGGASALMIAAKLNAALVLPLIILLGLARRGDARWSRRDVLARLGGFLGALAIGLMLLWAWDAARSPQSFWALNAARNNPGRVIRSDELLPRLDAWRGWLEAITGAPALNGALLAGVLAWLVLRFRDRSRAAAADWALALWIGGFLAWHWLVAVNTYDRYLHPLVPFALLLAARAAIGLARAVRFPRPAALAALALAIALLVPGAAGVLRGEAALGGDQGTHDGIDALADALNAAQRGHVVYDHWLGWELSFYLGRDPGPRIVYTPGPEALAAEVADRAGTRTFVAPSPADAAPWLDALGRAGVAVEIVYHDAAHGFVLYALAAR